MKHNQLFTLAVTIWGLVGLGLILRGADLYKLAVEEQHASQMGLSISIFASLALGGAKGKFLFSRTARRNMARISSLEAPLKPHQVYAGKFYFLILGMIGLGMFMRTYNDWFGGYIVVAAIYCGIGLALTVSSMYYWKGDPPEMARTEP